MLDKLSAYGNSRKRQQVQFQKQSQGHLSDHDQSVAKINQYRAISINRELQMSKLYCITQLFMVRTLMKIRTLNF